MPHGRHRAAQAQALGVNRLRAQDVIQWGATSTYGALLGAGTHGLQHRTGQGRVRQGELRAVLEAVNSGGPADCDFSPDSTINQTQT